ncbi:MAG: peptidoglycan DD-metalloendopeptidase family protein [Candidatus Zixiibacteriota bacterium]
MDQKSYSLKQTLEIALLSLFFVILFLSPAEAIRWPFNPSNVSLPLGNDYGEYQNYGDPSYFHPGIDILQPFGTHVYAVKAGIVKAVLTTSAQYHWRVAIGDSAGSGWCDGWLYAHLDQPTIQVQVGDTVQPGDYLGNLVYWPTSSFHHLHFVKIRNQGATWAADWKFIGNPLDELTPINDPDPPVIENARESDKFAFCHNNTHTYFNSGSPLSGDVDIVSKIYDKINRTDWRLIPYRIEYSIFNDSLSFGPVLSFIFTDTLFWDQNVDVVYQEDAVCQSQGDYDYRNFYFIVTNTDGDSVIEASDRNCSWRTGEFPNAYYWVKVTAHDRYGGSDSDSMQVRVENYFQVSGKVGLSDNPPDSSGSVIQLVELSAVDTTNRAGSFLFNSVGGGHYSCHVTHPGYSSLDTSLQVSGNPNPVFRLQVQPYIRGDANHDQRVDVGDVVYLINYLFKGGQPPLPFFSGDVNGDTRVDTGDVIYLVNYLYKEGPAPRVGRK